MNKTLISLDNLIATHPRASPQNTKKGEKQKSVYIHIYHNIDFWFLLKEVEVIGDMEKKKQNLLDIHEKLLLDFHFIPFNLYIYIYVYKSV